MPLEEELDAHLDELNANHEQYILDLAPSSDEDHDIFQDTLTHPEVTAARTSGIGNQAQTFDFSDMSIPMSSTTSTSSSSNAVKHGQSPGMRSLGELGIKPQFNLNSAEKLLSTFRDDLLPNSPCVVLRPGIDVRSMSKESPFVLLAILAVTSCITHLQGHSLYDEEFRKVLGIKFVTGGERSVELLQGLLVYCSWSVLITMPHYGTGKADDPEQVSIPLAPQEQTCTAISSHGYRCS
jgi:hypothetical protein